MPHDALLSIGLLIIVAKLAEGVLRRFRINAIVAYAATGVLLGPLLGIVEPTPDLSVLLNIGIFVFFFLIGLDEVDIGAFVASVRGRYFVAATLSVAISLGVSLTVTSDFVYDFGLGLDFTTAFAVAGILALSSLGLVAKVLADSGRLNDPVGIQIFTTVIIAEMLALLLVGFAIGEHGEDWGWLDMLMLLGQIVAFTVVTWLLSKHVVPPVIDLLQRLLHVPQLSFGVLLGGLFLVVLAAELIGLHGSLGALLFGAALSGVPYQVRRTIIPGMRSVAEGVFVPLFFASAGLYLSLAFLSLPPLALAALVIVPVIAHFAGAFIGAYVARLKNPFAQATGLMSKGVAETALLLVLLEAGAIGQDVFSLLVLVMFCYMLLMPMLIGYGLKRAKPVAESEIPDQLPSSLVHFALEGIEVGDILDRARRFPSGDLSVRDFVDHWVETHQQDYVVANDGVLAGIVSVNMLRYRPKDSWADTALKDVLRENAPTAMADEPVEDALQRMTENSLTALPVLERHTEQLLGVVTSHDLLELIVTDAKAQ